MKKCLYQGQHTLQLIVAVSMCRLTLHDFSSAAILAVRLANIPGEHWN